MKNILAAIDFSKTADAVLEQAGSLAKALGAKLWIVHVASDQTQALLYDTPGFAGFSPEFASPPGDVQLARDIGAEEFKREHKRLQELSTEMRGKGADAQALLLKGDAARLIVEKAADLAAEIIVIGSHGHGLLHKALLGSVSEAVIRRARCNVLVVPRAQI